MFFNAALFRLSAMCLALCLLCHSFCFAQSNDLKFQHYTSAKGLPQNTIHGIVKDKYGFMWFGTWSGLCKFDGYKFTTYRYDPDNHRSINNNRIHNIIKDSHGNIWIQTFDADELCKYNYDTDDFERIPDRQVSARFKKLITRRYHFLTVNFRYKDYHWSLDNYTNSLVRKSLTDGRVKNYSSNSASQWSLNDPYVTDLYLDNHNILWVGTYNNGINKANLNAKPFNYFYHSPTDKNSIIDNNIRAITEDNAGNLWIGTRDKGITIIRKNGNYQHLRSRKDRNSISSDQIKKIFSDSRGYIWIGTKKGLDGYDPSTGSIRHFDMFDLENTTVWGVTEDHRQNLWFATWKGVYKYITGEDRMIHFDPSKTLMSGHAKVIMRDKKHQIWVGTEGGGVSVLKD
jgi:ligand-binding sensor domain-containing protein